MESMVWQFHTLVIVAYMCYQPRHACIRDGLMISTCCRQCHDDHSCIRCSNLYAAQSELAMLRAEVRALADNLKEAENRAGLQVSFDDTHASLLF